MTKQNSKAQRLPHISFFLVLHGTISKNLRAFEPDYVLFLRIKGTDNRYDNLQIFIEPKGNQLLKTDKWKEDFLLQIRQMGDVQWLTKANSYEVWGLPFYNEERENDFNDAFSKCCMLNERQEEANAVAALHDAISET